jgi:DNA repair protein RadC
MNTPNSKTMEEPCPVCYKPPTHEVLNTTEDALACLQHFRDKSQEYFVCLSLNGARRLINRRVVTIGLVNEALAHPREVFAGPLADRATSVIIAHNHPSGVARPSDADIQTTQQLLAASRILAIPLTDHLIVTKNSY